MDTKSRSDNRVFDAKELSKLIKFLRKQGVTEYATPELSLKLGAQASTPNRVEPTTKDDLAGLSGTNYTEDETLFWSSPELPEESA